MANVEKLSVAVTPEMSAKMREVVDAGEYASASEVVREALREWTFRRARQAQAVTELGRLWDEGIASGPADDADAVFDRLRGEIGGKAARRGV